MPFVELGDARPGDVTPTVVSTFVVVRIGTLPAASPEPAVSRGAALIKQADGTVRRASTETMAAMVRLAMVVEPRCTGTGMRELAARGLQRVI
eukprot:1474153-Rhodomonas_salina.3